MKVRLLCGLVWSLALAVPGRGELPEASSPAELSQVAASG